MSKKIVFISDKGGISKTDTTYNMGVALALKGKKVLLVGADMKTDLNTRANAFSNVDYLNSFITSGTFIEPVNIENTENLFILPRSQRFLDEEIQAGTFKSILNNFDGKFDYILIDTTANLGRAAKDCLFASDASIILTDHDVLSFDGVHQLIPDITFCQNNINPNHQFFIIQVKYRNIKDCNSYQETLKSTFGEDKVMGKISYSEVYYKARKELVSIYNRPKDANYQGLIKARIEYDYLANLVINKI